MRDAWVCYKLTFKFMFEPKRSGELTSHKMLFYDVAVIQCITYNHTCNNILVQTCIVIDNDPANKAFLIEIVFILMAIK